MKATLLFQFLVLLLAIPSKGAVVVYRHSQSSQYIGQGFNVSLPATGFVVFDSQSHTGYTIAAYKLRGQKYFTTTPFEEGLRSYSVTGPRGRVYTAFVGSTVTNKPTHFEDGLEFSIGANVALAITPTNTVNLPRVLSLVGRGVVIPTGEPGIAVMGRGVASYSHSETRLANSLAETPGDSLARYRSLLLSRGYQEEPE
jgi:hypothetical protein